MASAKSGRDAAFGEPGGQVGRPTFFPFALAHTERITPEQKPLSPGAVPVSSPAVSDGPTRALSRLPSRVRRQLTTAPITYDRLISIESTCAVSLIAFPAHR